MRELIHGLLAAGVLLGIPGTVLAAEGAPAVDTGDTAWVLISAALVMLMTPGLAFFYGGMVRSKNVLTTIMQSFFIVAMVSVQWVLFGFLPLLTKIIPQLCRCLPLRLFSACLR